MGVDKDMAMSDFLDDPLGTMFEPFTDLFEGLIHPNAGQVFWLFPIIVLTFGVHLKVKNPAVTSLFMLGVGAALSGGGMFLGASSMAAVFLIFTAVGFVGLFMSLYFQR